MINRISYEHIEGSSTLPSILKLNNHSHFEGNTAIATQTNIPAVMRGTIGNNYSEFSIIFLADSILKMTPAIRQLYNSVVMDAFVTINADIEIKRKFKIFEINDSSFQAMTMNNYDMLIKLFISRQLIEADGSSASGFTSIFTDYQKITNNAIAIIKAYTDKRAWIIVDNSVIGSNDDKFKLFIDFTYKFFKDETSDEMRFPAVSSYNYGNVQDLLNITQLSSPYYDTYLFHDENDTKTFLNKQSDYLTREMYDLHFSTPNGAYLSKHNVPGVIDISALRLNAGGLSTLDLDKFKVKIIDHSSDTVTDSLKSQIDNELSEYIKSLSYEIYGYGDIDNFESSISYGNRVFTGSKKYRRYEIFPVISSTVHYIYKYSNGSGDPTKKDIRTYLKNSRQYLYNFKDLTISTFTEDGDKFIDVYSHIPYTYEAYDDHSIKVIPDDDSNSFGSTDFQFTDPLDDEKTNDVRSMFDASYSHENSYVIHSNFFNVEDETLPFQVPYFGNDIFVRSVIDLKYSDLETNSDTTTIIPQIFSDDIDLLELKKARVIDTYFDIIGKNDEIVGEDEENHPRIELLKQQNQINLDSNHNAEAMIDQFKDLGLRTSYDAQNINYEKLLERIELENDRLNGNLFKLLPAQLGINDNIGTLRYITQGTNADYGNSEKIDLEHCFFLCILTNTNTKCLNLKFEYAYTEDPTKNIYFEKLCKPCGVKSIMLDDRLTSRNCYIIPSTPELRSVSIVSNVHDFITYHVR